MPVIAFFPIDDDDILQAAGAKYLAINEPNLIIGHNGKDNRPIEVILTSDWQNGVSVEIEEKAKRHFADEITARLLTYVGNKIYVENADLIAPIIANGKHKRNEGDEDEEEGDNKNHRKAHHALELAIKHSKEVFVDEFGRPFAAMIMMDGHVENHPMDEQRFKNWISSIYYAEEDDLLSEEQLKKIVRILTAKAEFDGSVPRHRLDVRVRGYKHSDNNNNLTATNTSAENELTEDFDAIYYDLTNKEWAAIKITAEGWEIDKHPPILFRRYGSELPQPYPDRNYNCNVFDEFIDSLNLKPERKELLKQILKPLIIIIFWTNTIPKPLLIVVASQGSGKTTGFDLIRDLVDPNSALTMSLPREDVNLKQSLAHNYVNFYDNVSDISDAQSDTLCRAVTGAGDMKRKLYENDDDIIYNNRRVVGINGITNAATRSDLLDRGVEVEFGEIPRNKRKLQRVIWQKHLVSKPKLLGFCFDVVAEVMAERQKWKGIDDDYFGMKDLIDSKGGLPRLADWAILAEQVSAVIARKEGKPYTPGQCLDAIEKNLEILNIEALKSSLVAEAIIAFMTEREVMELGIDYNKYGDKYSHWEGSPTILLSELNAFLTNREESIGINIRSKGWPQTPMTFGKKLAEITPNLRPLGIVIESEKLEHNTQYIITKLPPVLPVLPAGDNSLSDEDKTAGSSTTNVLPDFLPADEGQKHSQNDMTGGTGSTGSKLPNLGGKESSIVEPSPSEQSITDIIQKAMTDNHGNKRNYCSDRDIQFVAYTMPNVRWTDNEIETGIKQLLNNGELKEIGRNQYRPTEKFYREE